MVKINQIHKRYFYICKSFLAHAIAKFTEICVELNVYRQTSTTKRCWSVKSLITHVTPHLSQILLLHCSKMKFSVTGFFSKCDQIRCFLRIWSYLPKKFLTENFLFCAVLETMRISRRWVRYTNWFFEITKGKKSYQSVPNL